MSSDKDRGPASTPASEPAQPSSSRPSQQSTTAPGHATAPRPSGPVYQQGSYLAYHTDFIPAQGLQPTAHSYPRPMNPYTYSAPSYPRSVSDPQHARAPMRSEDATSGPHDSFPYAGAYAAPYQTVNPNHPTAQAGRTRWAWVQMQVPEQHVQDEDLTQYPTYTNTFYAPSANAVPPIYHQYADPSASGTYHLHPAAQYDPYLHQRHHGHYPPHQPHVVISNRPMWRPPLAASASSSSHLGPNVSARRQSNAASTTGHTLAPRRSGTVTYLPPQRGGTVLPRKPSSVHADSIEDHNHVASPTELDSASTAQKDDSENRLQGDDATDFCPAVPGRGLRPHYHPQQGPRSEFVLWCGNVPQNATVEELWELFSRPAPDVANEPSSSSQITSSASDDRHALHTAESDYDHGVLSIFIISRSNCAFVNYASPEHLERAVARFHGQAVRPQDPRCPKLVCRIRKKDDEAQAGVAGQRNRGIHVAWLKEQKLAELKNTRASVHDTTTATPETSAIGQESEVSEPISPSLTTASKDTQNGNLSAATAGSYSSSGSASYASTNSSLFRHPAFRHRFFILKSLRREDLGRSIETGYWSTQPHNEAILDQAYRNSESVFLIFGVNQTGQFHGYARMAGPINTTTEPASRDDQRKSTLNAAVSNVPANTPPSTIMESPHEDDPSAGEQEHPTLGKSAIDAAQALFPAADSGESGGVGQLPMTSPLPITPLEEAEDPSTAADSETGTSTPRRPASRITCIAHSSSWPYASVSSRPATASSQDQRRSESPSASGGKAETDSHGVRRLDTEATSSATLGPTDSASWSSGENRLAEQIALRAVIHNLRLDEIDSRGKAEQLENQLRSGSNDTDATITSKQVSGKDDSAEPPRHSSSDSWGKPFRVDWIRTDQLPFHRVKKLRNPWRDHRQVKVSRDGTELEPGVGQQLLQEWNRDVAATSASTSSVRPGVAAGSDEDE